LTRQPYTAGTLDFAEGANHDRIKGNAYAD
jgi:hypothetical protein